MTTQKKTKASKSGDASDSIMDAIDRLANAARSISHGSFRPEGLEALSMALAGEGPWGNDKNLAYAIQSGLDGIASAIRDSLGKSYHPELPTSDTLMDQAASTACHYMTRGVDFIDEKFGDGYAAEHPALLSAFMRTAAHDFDTAMRERGR